VKQPRDKAHLNELAAAADRLAQKGRWYSLASSVVRDGALWRTYFTFPGSDHGGVIIMPLDETQQRIVMFDRRSKQR
jgi:hypothetical protein